MGIWKHKPSNLELLERMESLERRFKTLLEDVDEYFQMVRRAENRIKTKQAKMDEQEAGQTSAEEPTPAPVDLGRGLTPRESAILAIAKRRRLA